MPPKRNEKVFSRLDKWFAGCIGLLTVLICRCINLLAVPRYIDLF